MAEKLYYSMGEVTEMLDVAPSLIRYWGTQFDALRPHRNKKGNRMFTPEDLEVLKMIYHLVKEQGMTIAGAKKALRARRATSSVSSAKWWMLPWSAKPSFTLISRTELPVHRNRPVPSSQCRMASRPSRPQ